MVGEWRHGLCNCFDDIGICIIAYFVPCVTFGQNAEAIGEGSCLLCGTYTTGLNYRFRDLTHIIFFFNYVVHVPQKRLEKIHCSNTETCM